MRFYLFIIFGFLFYYQTIGQNLVPNPGFEDYSPGNTSGGSAKGYECDEWYTPNDGTPDFFIKWSLRENDMDNWPGFKLARNGECYFGIITRFVFNWTGEGNYREYITCKLKKPLTKGLKYEVTFYIRRAVNALYATTGPGAYFSRESPDTVNYDGYLRCTPQIISDNLGIIKETEHYIKINGTFTAEGGEQYMTIGNFKSNFNTSWESFDDMPDYNRYLCAYYYIDDVSVIPVNYYKNDLDIGSSNILEDISFRTGDDEVLAISEPELKTLLKLLREYPTLVIEIAGHTDNTGNEKANQLLSLRRAKSVAEYLYSQGISKSRIKYKGYGSKKPIADNSTKEGRDKNRRVEFTVLKL